MNVEIRILFILILLLPAPAIPREAHAAPGRQTWQVWKDHPLPLKIRALTTGQKYYFAVEAFNENGTSPLVEVKGVE